MPQGTHYPKRRPPLSADSAAARELAELLNFVCMRISVKIGGLGLAFDDLSFQVVGGP